MSRSSAASVLFLRLTVLSARHSMEPTDETDSSASPTPGSAAKGKGSKESERAFPFAVERATLDNGMKVLLVPTPSDGLVSYWTIVRTGSRDEVEEGVTGFA